MTTSPRGRDDMTGFDVQKRYVRLLRVRPDDFVEFEFSIGDPDLAMELILPAAAYREFCRDNHVTTISPLQGASIDRARRRWCSLDSDYEEF